MDTRELKAKLKKQREEIPFATALALTKTAQDMQFDIIKETKKRFTIRKTWLEKGKYAVRITPANKRTLTAKVWNDAPWMQSFERGELRKPKRESFAVPTDQVKRNKRDIITRSNRPKQLTRSFKIRTRQGNEILLIRRGKKVVKYVYSLIKSAKINPQWKFVETGTRSARKNWQKNINIALTKVLR